MRLILLAIVQSILLCGSQTLLKIAMSKVPAFSWTWACWSKILGNLWLLGSGLGFAASAVMWMYILRHFPFSHAYPLISMAYVMGMLVGIFFFHETAHWTQWVGIVLILGGCVFIAQ